MGDNGGAGWCCLGILIIAGFIWLIHQLVTVVIPLYIAPNLGLAGSIAGLAILCSGSIIGLGAGVYAYGKSFKRHMIDENSGNKRQISHLIMTTLIIAGIVLFLILTITYLITNTGYVMHIINNVVHIK